MGLAEDALKLLSRLKYFQHKRMTKVDSAAPGLSAQQWVVIYPLTTARIPELTPNLLISYN